MDTNNAVHDKQQQVFTKSLLNYSAFRNLSDEDMLKVLQHYHRGIKVIRKPSGEVTKSVAIAPSM